MPVPLFALTVVTLLGHAALWVGLINFVHASGLSRRTIKWLTLACIIVLCGVPLAVAAVWRIDIASPAYVLRMRLAPWWWAYTALCCVVALVHYPRWLWYRLRRSGAAVVVDDTSTKVDIAARVGRPLVHGLEGRLLGYVPGNQVCRLVVRELVVAPPRLPPALDGLVVAHLSDLHLSGRIDIGFFHEVVDLCNGLQPDLIALTGDVCDRRMCLDWIEPTLGRLRARLGAYYVLGNHDLRIGDEGLLRRTLNAAGWIDVAQRPIRVSANGESILIAGNERPWFPLSNEAARLPERPADSRPFSLLLAHSPDQLGWARRRGFDVMLSGHTHGGQIRMPLIGAIFSHSRGGVRYASGVVHEPPTLLHVSHGTSSLTPLRLNCPPEITKLVLVRQL